MVRRRINALRSRLPKPSISYSTLKAFDRHRRICLGLPVTEAAIGIPYGYIANPDSPGMIEPIEEVFELLVKGKEHLKSGYTFADVAEWINSHEVVQKYDLKELDARSLAVIMKTRQPFDEAATLSRDEREKL
jgi:hypothetical protein